MKNMPSEEIRCQGWTSRREFRNNLPCGNRAQKGKRYCKIHDPELHDERERRMMQRRAGEQAR
jgi:hypothetical protein